MAEGRDDAPVYGTRTPHPWTEIFRCFQVALDPRKLLVAAAGILAMSLGWYLLSLVFNQNQPDRNAPAYTDAGVLKRELGDKRPDGTDYAPDDYARYGARKYDRDLAQWRVLHGLAGEGGRLRTLPWYEYRGPNPYTFVTTLLGGSAVERQESVSDFFTATVPVLVEPLVKLLVPIVKIVDPDASTLTRVYLLLVIVWSLAVWAFFGGVITRIAAVQLTGKDRISLRQAVQFVADRYLSYLLSPLIPLGIVAVITVALILFGLLALIPLVGDILLYGLLLPLVILAGVVMAILLVGLVGYPLMYTTLSVEGSDTFDALSRAYNYVFQSPWQYIGYSLVAVVYGAAVTFFVVFVASLMVYLGKWGVTQTPFNESANRRPDYLFVYAPESFGWKELLLRGSPLEQNPVPGTDPDSGRKVVRYVPADPARAEAYKQTYYWYNWSGAGMVAFWLVLVFLLMLGFIYSYYWSAATMIYLLMRRKVDEVDLDEVYLEEEPEAPITPPAAPPASAEKPGAASLPMVPPPPPANVAFTGPVGALTPPASPPPSPTAVDGEKKVIETPKADDEKE